MALSDLFDTIESFDYNRVGKQNQPQTFEANGSVVTGNQTFGRPIETPLPIQEVIVGYGLRKTAQDFLSNDYASGFSIGMSSTQFNFLSDESSTYVPELSFGNTTYTQGTDNITFQDNLIIQNSLDFTGIVDGEFRRQTNRISDWVNTPSNFLEQDDIAAADFSLNTDYITAHNAVISNTISISPGRGNQYPNSFVQTDIAGYGPPIKPNRLEEFATKALQDDDRVILIPTDDDSGNAINGSQSVSDKKQKGFTNYIQEMSPGKNSPFIVKKIGSNYGLGDLGADLGPSVAQDVTELLGKGINILDNIAGGFVRGTPDTISGRVHREFDDALRKGKFIISGTGLLFGLKQFGLQLFNRTIETRIWNPVSLFSTDFYHMKRHLGGMEYGGLMRDPVKEVGKVAPAFLQPVLEPIFTSIYPSIGDGNATSRTALQVMWVDGTDAETIAPPEGGSTKTGFNSGVTKKLVDSIANKVSSALNKVLSEGKIALHNPNHYFRIGGILDPYAGPEGGSPIDEVKRTITKVEGVDGTTFGDKKNLKDRYQDYAFKTYGDVKDAASKKDSRHRYVNAYKENIIGKAPQNPNAGLEGGDHNMEAGLKFDSELKSWTERDKNFTSGRRGQAFNKQTDFYISQLIGPLDKVNAHPLSPSGIEYDFIDFYFKTRQWVGTKQNKRYLQFSAVLNNINESVSPEYSEQRYLGRPDKYYVYNGVDRDVSLEFTLYPHSKDEMPFLMEKLNYLVGLCYPQYSETGMMIAPQADLTIGDMFRDQPGYIQTLSINVQDNTTWETDLFQFPKHITANLTFRYFGKHVPHQFGKHYDIPYLDPFTDSTATGRPQSKGSLFDQVNYNANKKSEKVELYKKSITRRVPNRIDEGTLREIGEQSVKREIAGGG